MTQAIHEPASNKKDDKVSMLDELQKESFLSDFYEECRGSSVGSTERMIYYCTLAIIEALTKQKCKCNPKTLPTRNTGW